ncbi:cupin domain-containing protein [Brevundimonas naejangsanensis]|uniref:(R)-mandelonitrile lyase n=1 Tax=Brevundimonas naejangsanensis TaxID=588932 RepID=UPI0004221E1E|nr:cupin domain-containing protein [Brevundimonas naejangsanensis]
MSLVLATLAGIVIAMPAYANSQVVVTRTGSQPSSAGSPDNFTGAVRVEDRFQGSGESRISGATVTFEPGARTAWHTHPLGQTLIVTAGAGRVQHWGGPIQEIRPGDTVWIPPGVKHWHGAGPLVGMSHIAFSEALDGKTVEWMEQVTEDQYNAR